jgi:hypothetical protein
MKFATVAQKACYEKIQPWLNEMYENLSIPLSGLPVFILPMGSATAMVEVLPWGNSEAIIATWSYVVKGVEQTADLMRFLLQQNSELQTGVFSIDDDGHIRFHAIVVGSTCDRQELRTSVAAVLETADRYDLKIVKNWGGERA